MLSGTLGEILQKLSTTLDSYPRKVPGTLHLDGVPLQYADLHSFYHQAYQIFATQLYNFETHTKDPYIIDCGAHIGIATLFFKSRYPTSTIRAFEADPKIHGMLSANIQNFGLQQVIAEQKAVWIHNDGVSFSQENDDSGSVTMQTSQSTVLIPSIRLKDILLEKPVDLLKVDIEGAEFETFHDASEALKNVKRIVCEVHLLSPNQKLHPLLTQLDSLGFKYGLSDLHHATWLPPHEVPPLSAIKTDRWLVTVFAWK
jgi:FkbM family methyltransferase